MKKATLRQYMVFFIIGAVIIFLFAGADSLGYTKGIKNFFSFVTAPMAKMANGYLAGISDFWEKFNRVGKIYRENAELRDQNAKLQSELSKFDETQRENNLLKQLLQFPKPKEYRLTEANVIIKNSDVFGQYLVLDKGTDDGIKTDDTVIVSEGVLVGKVTDAAARSSKIRLVISTDSAVAAISQENRATGVIKGEYNLSLLMDMVNPTAALEPGDHIITSGQDDEFPKGLLIGSVKEINAVPGYIFKTAVVNSPVDFGKLETVFIMSK